MIKKLIFPLVLAFVVFAPALSCAESEMPPVDPTDDGAGMTDDGDMTDDSDPTDDGSSSGPELVLVFSKTEGFRHGSISAGKTAISELGTANSFDVDFSEDSSDFTEMNLSLYDLVIFLNTTGDILNGTQEAVFEDYIRNGGAFMGVHSATDTEYDWAWYGGLVGAYFDNHPNIQNADIEVLSSSHPSTSHLSSTWSRRDEWYNFGTFRSNVTPLLNLDEDSYNGGEMGNNHPISWHHIYEGARSFYTGMGHTNESYEEEEFRDHLLGGILWCLKRA